ncbi:2709_t:CDS:2, partial [Entrophospora sp. SA101]
YPYTPSDLEHLTNKTALFLLDYFHQVFQNINAITKVEVRCLPTGYSAGFPPSPGLCDDCHKILDENGAEYYKNGINKNVSSFLHRLEKEKHKIASNLQDALDYVDKW